MTEVDKLKEIIKQCDDEIRILKAQRAELCHEADLWYEKCKHIAKYAAEKVI